MHTFLYFTVGHYLLSIFFVATGCQVIRRMWYQVMVAGPKPANETHTTHKQFNSSVNQNKQHIFQEMTK